jgi:L-histidine N-alpha-methyltransferase
MAQAAITVDTCAPPTDRRELLINDVRSGLARNPKELPPRWFYDDVGSQLFEEITHLPEYYLTRTEIEILNSCAQDIVGRAVPESIVDLGAGSSAKTRILLEAALHTGRLSHFVPFDVSREIMEESAADLVARYPGLQVHAVLGDFDSDLRRIPRYGRQLVVFLGSTIGNLYPLQRDAFLRQIRVMLQPGDTFLLGLDLVKGRWELEAAYDDSAGVTSRFNLNLLAVINRELAADFDLSAFEHVAIWNQAESQMEMYLRSTCNQRVTVARAGIKATFRQGELMRTEISAKFTRGLAQSFLRRAGMEAIAWYTDRRHRFALALGAPGP